VSTAALNTQNNAVLINISLRHLQIWIQLTSLQREWVVFSCGDEL